MWIAVRTTARTTPFMPGESPPEVMTAIFFFGAAMAGEQVGGGFVRVDVAEDELKGMKKRTRQREEDILQWRK